ncbi:MAG: YhdP family protein [Rhodoferax sp.]
MRTGAFCARWALRLLALAWLAVLLVWALLHVWIVPRVGEWRPWLEQRASAALGVEVRIAAIEARSTGLVPAVALRDVRLLDAQGQTALSLGQVQVALSPRSLLGWGFEQLHVQSPVLELRRDAQGRLFVAGLPVDTGAADASPLLDWLFSQPEVALLDGVVRWVDDMRGGQVVELRDVDLVLRNRLFTHAWRIDASPAAHWGQRLQLMGRFKEPVLSRHAGNWRIWRGQAYAWAPEMDLQRLAQWLPVPVQVGRGHGSLRAWVDWNQGQVDAATVDLAVRDLAAQWRDGLAPLELRRASARLGWEQGARERRLWTQDLQFDTADGLHWPGGNVAWVRRDAEGVGESRHRIEADRLDLAALAELALRLPVPQELQQPLAALRPRGVVQRLVAQWSGQDEAWPEDYSIEGLVQGLGWQAQGGAQSVGVPGASGVDLEFSATPTQGQAQLRVQRGGVDAAGVFEQAWIPLERLRAELRWKRNGARWEAQVRRAEFANADAEGAFDAQWYTDAAHPLPGVLDLRGELARANGAQVHRYLPLQVDASVREYLRSAIVAAQASNVKFRLQGALRDFPFERAGSGEFSVSAQVRNAHYVYAPPLVQGSGEPPWPALQELSCDFSLRDGQILLRNLRAGLQNAPSLVLTKGEASIGKLYGKPQLAVSAEARLDLGEGLAWVKASPLPQWIGHFLDDATGSGAAELRLRLGLPLAGVGATTVQGSVQLQGAEVALGAPIPRLQDVRGTVQFSDSAVTVAPTQARALGGEVRVEGALSGWGAAAAAGQSARTPQAQLRIQGVATGEGLRQAQEWGALAPWARYASGSAAYSATVALQQGLPDIELRTSLAGMALNLPAPLGKTAQSALPLRLQTRWSRAPGQAPQQQIDLALDGVGSATYVLEHPDGRSPAVLRGALALGLGPDESAPLPPQGVVANLQFEHLDLNAWSHLWDGSPGASGAAGAGAAPGAPAAASASSAGVAGMALAPTSVALRARSIEFEGRRFSQIVVGAAREGPLWRANLDAAELSGYLEYRPTQGPQAGRLYARLARLVVAPNDAQEVEERLDEQPASIPALDIVVEDFELRGRKLGRLDIDAVNVGALPARETAREWRLNRFNLSMPEATLTAYGHWAPVGASSASAARSARERRRTVMNFKLDVADAGEFLARFGMKDVVRKGQGRLEGQIGWMGSPITLDYQSMGGNASLNIENGQFLKADPGLAKLLGVLSLQSLPRRLTLDFRDVFSEGFVFDFIRGDVTVAQGIARTNNLQMKGVNAAVLMEGQADLEKETQALKVVVVPEINAGSASLIASAINPVVGLTSFLAQWILRRPLSEITTQEFFIDGTWVDPRVTRVNTRTTPGPAGPPKP